MHFNIYTQLSHKHWTCALSSKLKAISAASWAVILCDNFTGQFFHNLNPDNVQNSFLKVSFSQIFYHFMYPNKFVLYFPIQKQTTVGQNYYHFSSTKKHFHSLYPLFTENTHILLALHTEMLPSSFFNITIFNPWIS